MHQLSTIQILQLWHQLERAFYDDNTYGGTIAEIYQYTLMRSCPSVDAKKLRGDVPSSIRSLTEESANEAFQEANEGLYSVLAHFIKQLAISNNEPGVRILIEEREFGTWVRELGQWHRMHIKVENLRV